MLSMIRNEVKDVEAMILKGCKSRDESRRLGVEETIGDRSIHRIFHPSVDNGRTQEYVK